jgi:hypothetical protein
MNYSKNADFTMGEVTNIKVNSLYCFVWGIVYYDDGFGQKCFTRFCHRYNAECYRHIREGFFIGKWGLVSEGAKYHQWGNEAD